MKKIITLSHEGVMFSCWMCVATLMFNHHMPNHGVIFKPE